MPPSLYKKMKKLLLLVKGGQANFLKSTIANLHIFGLIPQSQVRKFQKYVCPQIANTQICIINPQILHNSLSKQS